MGAEGCSAAVSSRMSETTTATKLAALSRKHSAMPPRLITMPAIAGPTTRATLTITELRLTALRRSSGPTISSTNDCRAGFSKQLSIPSSRAST